MDKTKANLPHKKQSRIQIRNRKRIMDAALIVFSENGYRGATLDQIARESGLSKPNILYCFEILMYYQDILSNLFHDGYHFGIHLFQVYPLY